MKCDASRVKLIASTHNRSYNLLSYKYQGREPFLETHSLTYDDAYRENVIGEKRRFENRVARPLSPSSSRRRTWSSEISDFSRARGWQIESPRTFARSEEDGKARKSRRAGLARGYRKVKRYRESQPVWERKRVGRLDEGLGDVRAYKGIQGVRWIVGRVTNGEGWIGACVVPSPIYLSAKQSCHHPGALCLSLSRGAALLDNKLYSTSTGTVLRTTGSPTIRRRPPVGHR